MQNALVQYYDITVSDLNSTKRNASAAVPRQLCMYLMRKYVGLSYKRIGTIMGGKDHSTVLYACKKIETELLKNEEIHEVLGIIERSTELSVLR